MKNKEQKLDRLADEIYDLISKDVGDIKYGDILGALELVKLWIHRDFVTETVCPTEEDIEKTYVFRNDVGMSFFIDATSEEEAYNMLDDTVQHSDEFECVDIITDE